MKEGPRVLGKKDQAPSSWGDRIEGKCMEMCALKWRCRKLL